MIQIALPFISRLMQNIKNRKTDTDTNQDHLGLHIRQQVKDSESK
ncbi:hypothetical protein M078_4228 [Bacteroides fragilis str. 2-F-2 |nr:hypothetical protein M078_4228 [Bacteroides fragilis str. 2-F-2 \